MSLGQYVISLQRDTLCHVLWTDFAKYIWWPQHSRTKGIARIFVTPRTTRLSHSLNSPPHPNIWQLICILPTISPCRRRNAFDLCQHSWNSKTGHAACYCIMHLLCDLKNFMLDKSNPVGRILDTRVFYKGFTQLFGWNVRGTIIFRGEKKFKTCCRL